MTEPPAHPADDLQHPLSQWLGRAPLTLPPQAPLGDALQAMAEREVGSVMVVDETGAALGILTRHDLLDRVTLPGLPLHTPLAQVMSWPVHTLDAGRSAEDAALLMAREGVRHVPITEGGRVAGIVSERDLFALQRLAPGRIGATIDGARTLADLQQAAGDMRQQAARALAEGAGARPVTALQTQLLDRLTRRLVELEAGARGLDLAAACWLAFGSEGREEQTVLTDQDNGLVFAGPESDQPRWLALGAAVNEALAACGVPLCPGGIMAGRPECCRSLEGWQARFAQWIDHGAPEDVLAATIFFDLRPLAGATALADVLRRQVTEAAAATPRFLRQMAQAALSHRPPLAWHGGIGADTLDLKMQGTGLFVEAARVLALAARVAATSTPARLRAAGAALHVPAAECEAWIAGFDHLQALRLAAQAAGHGNRCDVAALNPIDRRVLREALHQAQHLQQRLELDWAR